MSGLSIPLIIALALAISFGVGVDAFSLSAKSPIAPFRLNSLITRASTNEASGTSHDESYISQRIRPRRNRVSPVIRSMVQENAVTVKDLIYPLFIQEGDESTKISSMPGCLRHSMTSMLEEIDKSIKLGVQTFVLFPNIADNLKTPLGDEALNPNGLVPRAIQNIKKHFPTACVMTDVALDPYSSMGHDGIVEDGKIVNDKSVEQLSKQALMHAKAGADIVAPSDMMDGRVGVIRDTLDENGFVDVGILAYTAKYASAFYGPFRDALHSHPGFGDKKTYQQDPANGREALLEAALDAEEGADMLMVKPGLPYLDVIHRLRESSYLPIAAYQVSGEYSMIKAAAAKGWLNERDAVMESLMGFKRAGADVILTYYARKVAQWLKDDTRNLYTGAPTKSAAKAKDHQEKIKKEEQGNKP